MENGSRFVKRNETKPGKRIHTQTPQTNLFNSLINSKQTAKQLILFVFLCVRKVREESLVLVICWNAFEISFISSLKPTITLYIFTVSLDFPFRPFLDCTPPAHQPLPLDYHIDTRLDSQQPDQKCCASHRIFIFLFFRFCCPRAWCNQRITWINHVRGKGSGASHS